ncbi:hypothetical protein K501DRAFT_278809 [Backusella circina FSU 941]|nr:hypothetical protein K501DRAFT_278809 [Backusella circina FSU 941]
MGVQNWVFVSDPKMAQDIFPSVGTITSGQPYWYLVMVFQSYCFCKLCILMLAFGTRVASSEYPLFKELVHIAVSGGKFTGPVFDCIAYFLILSFLDIIFGKEHKMSESVKTVTLLTFACLAKIAHENEHDTEVLVAGSDAVTVSLMWTPVHSNPNDYSNAGKFEPERFIDDTRSMYASFNGKVEFCDSYIYGWGAPTGPDGNKIYPDLNINIDDGVIILSGKYKVHFIKRTDCLI